MHKTENITVETPGQPIVVDRDSSASWIGGALVLFLVVAIAVVVMITNANQTGVTDSLLRQQAETATQQALTQQQLNENAARQAAADLQQRLSVPLPGPQGPAGQPGPPGPQGQPGEPAPSSQPAESAPPAQ